MSVTTSNEIDRLFSLAFGEHWVRAGLLARSSEELEEVSTLACDHVSNALNQLESIGRALGAGDGADMDVNHLGWAITSIAEYANVCQFMATIAAETRNPKLRVINESIASSQG